jgi:serine/threonine-protein kinase RsbW
MAYSTREPRVHLEIGSRLENVELAQIAVEASLQQLAIDETVSCQIGTAVREAVANAIKHGNKADASKQVRVDFGLEGSDVVISVQDEGAGFDPDNVPNPLEPENLLKPNGRGILLIREFMDRIEYEFERETGTALTMRKRVEMPLKNSDRHEEEEEE